MECGPPAGTYAARMGEEAAGLRVEIAGSAEQAIEAAALFDHPVDPGATSAFLADERHHLLICYVGGQPAGFVTAVELLHPDKPRPEMFLYELGVAADYRRMGVATALMQRLIELCHARGCGELFVLTDEGNSAAIATYRRAGGSPTPAGVMFQWDWRGADEGLRGLP
jgi:ribosomal protein S18 acetylase RimI-like enzyme